MTKRQRLKKTHFKLCFYIVPVFLFVCLVYCGLSMDLRYIPGIKSVSRGSTYSELSSFDSNALYPKHYDNAKYIVNTETCHIPDLDPYGTSIRKFITSEKHYRCLQSNLIAYREGFKIIVDKTVVEKYYQWFLKCSYEPYVKRIGKENDQNFYLFHKFQNFTEFINVTDEFCSICCYDKNDALLLKQQFAFVIRNETLIRTRIQDRYKNKRKSQNSRRKLNVIMIGLESTSRLNFIRQMNFTRTYLQKTLEAVELMGYNKVGLNTFPNMVAILLGITVDEMRDDSTFYDRYPFIWKDYMKAGYVTLYGEDNQGTFNYLRKGFQWTPVDYYMRPYVMELQKNSGTNNTFCSGNRLILQSVLDNMVDFVATYRDVPHFAFTFIGRPSHDYSNRLGIVDMPLVRTLTDLNTRGLLENTALMIFGDHGSRYGNMRNTLQGRLEENLPAFYVFLPKWFRKTHSNLSENLKANRKTLTSNFDIHATLQDILVLGGKRISQQSFGKYGTSLLRNIKTNRTCADLNIPIWFCACQAFVETYSTESRIVRDIAHWVVQQINRILSKVSHLCSHLTLGIIRQAWRSMNRITRKKPNITPPKDDFVIQFDVFPSNGEFEATVRYFKQKFYLLGEILRINKYAGQSDCVSGHKDALVLERYCYCRKNNGTFLKVS